MFSGSDVSHSKAASLEKTVKISNFWDTLILKLSNLNIIFTLYVYCTFRKLQNNKYEHNFD